MFRQVIDQYFPLLHRIYTYFHLKVGLFRKANSMIKYFLDEESIDILKLREKYYYSSNRYIFNNYMKKTGYKVTIPELYPYSKFNIVIYELGNKLYEDYLMDIFSKMGGYRMVRALSEVTAGDIIIPGTDEKNKVDNLVREIKKRCPGVNYYVPDGYILIATYGNQYFDVFKANEKETIIDGGSYDGNTDLDFIKWSNGDCKIYAVESDPQNIKVVEETLSSYDESRIIIINKGLWSEAGALSVSASRKGGAGSYIEENEDGDIVPVTTIDDIAQEDKVTFIKMDIEGAELKALHGAQETIIRDKPRLAICVYHKLADLNEIPQYIHKLDKSYRFVLRHYTSTDFETVLYASTNVDDFSYH